MLLETWKFALKPEDPQTCTIPDHLFTPVPFTSVDQGKRADSGDFWVIRVILKFPNSVPIPLDIKQTRPLHHTPHTIPHAISQPPITKLATEFLVEMFKHYVSLGPVITVIREQKGVVSPRMLAKVCSVWRKLALSIPTLWNRVSVQCEDWLDIVMLMRHVDEHFSHSGSAAISLHIIGPSYYQHASAHALFLARNKLGVHDYTNGGEIICRLLAKYRTRLKEVTLSFPASWFRVFAKHWDYGSRARPTNFPQLQSTEVVVYPDTEGEIDPPGVTSPLLICKSPLLRYIKISEAQQICNTNTTSRIAGLYMHLPYMTLTELDLTNTKIPLLHLGRIIKRSICLLSLSLTIFSPQNQRRPRPMTHLSLQSLTIHLSRNKAYNDFMSFCAFPSLRHLTITHTDKGWQQSSLFSFLNRMSCVLEVLSVDAEIDQEDITSLLVEIPSLTKLDIQASRPLSASLIRHLSGGILARNLEVINCVIDSATLIDFLDFLDMRSLPAKYLQANRAVKGAIIWCRKPEGEELGESVIQQLEELRNRRVTVAVFERAVS